MKRWLKLGPAPTINNNYKSKINARKVVMFVIKLTIIIIYAINVENKFTTKNTRNTFTDYMTGKLEKNDTSINGVINEQPFFCLSLAAQSFY